MPFLYGSWKPLTALGLLLAAWIVFAGTLNFIERVQATRAGGSFFAGMMRQPRHFFGMHTAHVGVAVFVVGVTREAEGRAEGDVIHAATALDLDFEARRKGVGHRNANAVQAAGEAVGVARFLLVELAARVQLAEDQFDGRPAFFRVDFDRDAAAVVADLDDPVGADDDRNLLGETGQSLVGRVVDDFLHDMGRAGRPGVHARAFLDGFEILEDADGRG